MASEIDVDYVRQILAPVVSIGLVVSVVVRNWSLFEWKEIDMKKIVNVQEVEGEGLLKLIGEKVLILCANYFYSGTLEGVNDECVLLGDDAAIVYETGEWKASTWKDAQPLGGPHYVMKSAIESFRKGK